METKPPPPPPSERSPRIPRLTRRRAAAALSGAIGLMGLSYLDSKMGVAPAPAPAQEANDSASPTAAPVAEKPLTPSSVADAEKSLTPSVARADERQYTEPSPTREVAVPKVEVLQGKEREDKLAELNEFFHEFFKPEAVEEFKSKSWIDDAGMIVEVISHNGKVTTVFKDKKYGQVKGQFENDPDLGVIKEFQINTTSEESNLKVFSREVRPRLVYDNLEFHKVVGEFEEDEDVKTDFQTMDYERPLPEDEAVDPEEDAKILNIYARLPLEHKLYREGNVNYVKQGVIVFIPGNSIDIGTKLERTELSSENQII